MAEAKGENEIIMSKSDIVWGYLAQLFSFASGVVILPFVLSVLTSSEIGLNYLMLTIAGIVNLLDFGFSPQFGRNFTYVFSGATSLSKEGIHRYASVNAKIDYKLLKILIESAKYVYRRIALLALFVMSTIGTMYTYIVTNGFTEVENSLLIWIIFSISTYFNIYNSLYHALLRGKGMVKEANQISILGRFSQIVLTLTFLFAGFGLLAIVISSFAYPIVTRIVTYKKFFTEQLMNELAVHVVTKESIVDTFNTIWHNARKLGIVFVGSFTISKIGLFIAGLYMSLTEISTYGLLLQVFALIVAISSNQFNVFQSRLNYLRVSESKTEILSEFSQSMVVFYTLFLFGSIFAITLAPSALEVIESNVSLPSVGIMIVYSLITLLEQNHSFFATLIASGNKIPFVKSSIISGVSILVGYLGWFTLLDKSLWALILVPGIVQIMYNNWKWPKVIFDEFGITISEYLKLLYKSIIEQLLKIRYSSM